MLKKIGSIMVNILLVAVLFMSVTTLFMGHHWFDECDGSDIISVDVDFDKKNVTVLGYVSYVEDLKQYMIVDFDDIYKW